MYAFTLPTTSHLTLGNFLKCESHPSLPAAATTARTVLRQALKSHHRQLSSLSSSSSSGPRGSGAGEVIAAAEGYLPYLLALEAGLCGRQVAGEEVVVALSREPEAEWRSGLGAALPGRRPARVRGRGLDFEILFVLATAGYAHCLDARRAAATFYLSAGSGVTPERRKQAMNAASAALMAAQALFARGAALAESLPAGTLPRSAVDVRPATLAALAELCLAGATLLVVIKDDDYLQLAAQSRDTSDREWMYKAPDIPKVRANLFLRFCVAAGDHAARAVALLKGDAADGSGGGGDSGVGGGSTSFKDGLGNVGGSGSVKDDFVKYARNLQTVARARAYRFLGIDAELGGRVGDALAYLNAARRELGLPVTTAGTINKKGNAGGDGDLGSGSSSSSSRFKPSLTQMKKGWAERREQRAVDGKGGAADASDDGIRGGRGTGNSIDGGAAAGRTEEGRVVAMLERDWTRANDLIHHQRVPDDGALLAESGLPGAREFHRPAAWAAPALEPAVLERLRGTASDGGGGGSGGGGGGRHENENENDNDGNVSDNASDASYDEIAGGQMPGLYPDGSAGRESTYF